MSEISGIRQDIRPDIRYPAPTGYPAGYPESGFQIGRISGKTDIRSIPNSYLDDGLDIFPSEKSIR